MKKSSMPDTRPWNACAAWAWPAPGATVNASLSCAAFILMSVYVIVLPIAHTIAIRHIAFFSLVLLTVWAAWKYRLKLYFPVAWPYAFYAVIALISVGYALDPHYSLSEVKKEVGYGAIALLLAASWIRSGAAISRLLMPMIAGNVMLVGYAIFDAIKTTPAWTQALLQGASREGSLSDVGYFSTYIIIMLPFIATYALLPPSANRIKRGLLVALLVMNVLALYLTGNRAGMITLIVEIIIGLLLITIYKGFKIRASLVIVGAMLVILLSTLFLKQMDARNVALLATDNTQKTLLVDDPRWQLNQRALENISKNPLAGAGFGREVFRLLNPDLEMVSDAFWHGHNVFLNKGVQMGIPGIVAFSILLLALLKAIWPARTRDNRVSITKAYSIACIVMLSGMVVKNLADDFFVRDNALLFWILAGAVLGAIAGEKAR